jgi:hypothetical protein
VMWIREKKFFVVRWLRSRWGDQDSLSPSGGLLRKEASWVQSPLLVLPLNIFK